MAHHKHPKPASLVQVVESAHGACGAAITSVHRPGGGSGDGGGCGGAGEHGGAFGGDGCGRGGWGAGGDGSAGSGDTGGGEGGGGIGGAMEQAMSTSVRAMSDLSIVPRMASKRKLGALTAALACLHCESSPLNPTVLHTPMPPVVACPGATIRSRLLVPPDLPIRYQKEMWPTWPEPAHAAPLYVSAKTSPSWLLSASA